MKKLVLLLLPLLLLTACPKDKEATVTEGTIVMEELADKKTAAIKSIDEGSWELEGLLTAHDYFFNFSERVLLLMQEPDSVKSVQKYIKKNGVKLFCENFLMPMQKWQTLENYCVGGSFYKCSPEIQEYSTTRQKLFDLLGADTTKAIEAEPTCN